MQNFLGGCVRKRAGWEGGVSETLRGPLISRESLTLTCIIWKRSYMSCRLFFSLPFVFGFCIGTQNGGWCKFWIFSYLDAGEFERTKEDWGLSYQGSLHVAGLSFSSMPLMTVWHTCVMILRPPKPDLGQPEARVKQPPFPSRVIWECFYWIKKVISLLIEFHQFFSIYREWLSPWFTGAPKP